MRKENRYFNTAVIERPLHPLTNTTNLHQHHALTSTTNLHQHHKPSPTPHPKISSQPHKHRHIQTPQHTVSTNTTLLIFTNTFLRLESLPSLQEGFPEELHHLFPQTYLQYILCSTSVLKLLLPQVFFCYHLSLVIST